MTGEGVVTPGPEDGVVQPEERTRQVMIRMIIGVFIIALLGYVGENTRIFRQGKIEKGAVDFITVALFSVKIQTVSLRLH